MANHQTRSKMSVSPVEQEEASMSSEPGVDTSCLEAPLVLNPSSPVAPTWSLDTLDAALSEEKNPFSGMSEMELGQIHAALLSEEGKRILQQTKLLEQAAVAAGDVEPSAMASGDIEPYADQQLQELQEQLHANSEGLDDAKDFLVSATEADFDLEATQLLQESLKVNDLPYLENSFSDHAYCSTPANVGKEEEETEEEEEDVGKTSRRRKKTTPPKRRSTRIQDNEQREMAEKIRQENLKQEQEALRAMRGDDSDSCGATIPPFGSGGVVQSFASDVAQGGSVKKYSLRRRKSGDPCWISLTPRRKTEPAKVGEESGTDGLEDGELEDEEEKEEAGEEKGEEMENSEDDQPLKNKKAATKVKASTTVDEPHGDPGFTDNESDKETEDEKASSDTAKVRVKGQRKGARKGDVDKDSTDGSQKQSEKEVKKTVRKKKAELDASEKKVEKKLKKALPRGMAIRGKEKVKPGESSDTFDADTSDEDLPLTQIKKAHQKSHKTEPSGAEEDDSDGEGKMVIDEQDKSEDDLPLALAIKVMATDASQTDSGKPKKKKVPTATLR